MKILECRDVGFMCSETLSLWHNKEADLSKCGRLPRGETEERTTYLNLAVLDRLRNVQFSCGTMRGEVGTGMRICAPQ